MSVVTEANSQRFLTFGLIGTGLIALTGVLCVNLSFSEDTFLIGGAGNWVIGKGSWIPARFALGRRGGGGDDSSIVLFLMRERERERVKTNHMMGVTLEEEEGRD